MNILLLAAALLPSYPTVPNKTLTPGDVLPVTASQLCVPGYAGHTRNVPESEKLAVYKEYGLVPDKTHPCEVDHLISLELGGSNNIKNLWPEPYFGSHNAHDKDKLEDRLHLLVCHGKIPLAEAQKEISTDWVAAYIKYIGPFK